MDGGVIVDGGTCVGNVTTYTHGRDGERLRWKNKIKLVGERVYATEKVLEEMERFYGEIKTYFVGESVHDTFTLSRLGDSVGAKVFATGSHFRGGGLNAH